MMQESTFFTSLLSGGFAGTAVDVSLYPLDTIKTRLQSPQGFWKAGGFKGIYRGLSAAATGSAPSAALFFSTYEFAKKSIKVCQPDIPEAVKNLLAGGMGEVAACLVRVPTEVVKQRMQTGMHSSAIATVRTIISSEGPLGMYTGFRITIFRELPFAFVQFPIYEHMKTSYARFRNKVINPLESAACGSIAGGIAAAVTTPLDVMKTRLMLGSDKNGVQYRGVTDTFQRLLLEGQQSSRGVLGTFFAGVQPRVMWISIGGFVFFGAYEQAKTALTAAF